MNGQILHLGYLKLIKTNIDLIVSLIHTPKSSSYFSRYISVINIIAQCYPSYCYYIFKIII